jgi:peptide subunit release factor 1 (eRF1)
MTTKTNIYDNLEEVFDEKTTNNVIRKANKKLREIDLLKQKVYLTEEEKNKIAKEKFWKSFLPRKKKLITKNKHNIGCSLEFESRDSVECPICLIEIPYSKAIQTNCNHVYCSDCTSKIIEKTEKGNTINCSLCRGKIKKYYFQNEDDMCNIMHILAYKK